MSCSATDQHSWGVCGGRLLWWAVLSLFTRCRIDGVAEWHVRDCCDVLRSPPGQQGDRGPLLLDYLRCHIDEGRIGSGLISVLHHGDVWSSRPGSSSGTCVCTSVALWLNVFPLLSAIAALCFSSLDLHHRAGGLHYSLNSNHDFMENHPPMWSCLFSFSHLNTQEDGLNKGLNLRRTLWSCKTFLPSLCRLIQAVNLVIFQTANRRWHNNISGIWYSWSSTPKERVLNILWILLIEGDV